MPERNVPCTHRFPALVALVLVASATSAQEPAPAATTPGASVTATAPAATTATTEPGAAAKPAPLDPVAGSYSIGLNFGSQLGTAGLASTLSVDELVRGIREGLAGKRPADDDKARMTQMLREGREAVTASNRAAASQFLAENGAIAGVVTTASGLQYTEVKAGDPKAAKPGPMDRVTVQYRGRLLDGTEFDNSQRHPRPATFALNGGVIKGWREALLMMSPGAQWRVFIPPELGYDTSPPPGIPPGSLLVFDVELVKVEPVPVVSSQAPKSQKAAKNEAARQPAAIKPNR